jgi:hypothetical protein
MRSQVFIPATFFSPRLKQTQEMFGFFHLHCHLTTTTNNYNCTVTKSHDGSNTKNKMKLLIISSLIGGSCAFAPLPAHKGIGALQSSSDPEDTKVILSEGAFVRIIFR